MHDFFDDTHTWTLYGLYVCMVIKVYEVFINYIVWGEYQILKTRINDYEEPTRFLLSSNSFFVYYVYGKN